jgi:hypothetical protein
MIRKLTPRTRGVLLAASHNAAASGRDRVHTGHLLLALVTEGGAVGLAIASLGLDELSVRAELRRTDAMSRPGGRRIDPDALAAIGIDFDAIRAAADQRFGAGVLGATLVSPQPRRSRWRPRRRAGRLSREARQAFLRGQRAAAAGGEPEVRVAHLLLGLLAEPTLAVDIIERLGVRPADVRAAAWAAGGDDPEAQR